MHMCPQALCECLCTAVNKERPVYLLCQCSRISWGGQHATCLYTHDDEADSIMAGHGADLMWKILAIFGGAAFRHICAPLVMGQILIFIDSTR